MDGGMSSEPYDTSRVRLVNGGRFDAIPLGDTSTDLYLCEGSSSLDDCCSAVINRLCSVSIDFIAEIL